MDSDYNKVATFCVDDLVSILSALQVPHTITEYCNPITSGVVEAKMPRQQLQTLRTAIEAIHSRRILLRRRN